MGSVVVDAGRGVVEGVGNVADGIWGGMKNAVSWVVGSEAPQPAEPPASAPVPSAPVAPPAMTQHLSLLPRLREERIPSAFEAVLNLKPVLAEQLPQFFADVLPRLDASLIPQRFQAALLLTPLMAGAVPDAFTATQKMASAPIMQKNAPVPVTLGVLPEMPDFQSLLRLTPDVMPLPNVSLGATVHPEIPSIAPLPLSTAVSIVPPRIAPTTTPLQWTTQEPPLPEAVPVDLLSGLVSPGQPLIEPYPAAVPDLPGRHMKILTEQHQRQDERRETAREQDASLRMLMENVLARLEAVAERPIDLAVTTEIDGRMVAEAVYKDMREQKIRNYETL